MTFSYRHFGAFRLLLASIVMFQHFTANAAPEAFRTVMILYWGGDIAVLVFFCLSGFVIAEAVDRIYVDRPLDFITNRLLRIAPHFIVAVLISILLHYVLYSLGILRAKHDSVIAPDFILAFSFRDILLNCIGFLPIPIRGAAHYDFLDVAWAVRVEMAFYLAVFLCLIVVRYLSWPLRSGLTMMALGATALYAAAVMGVLPAKVGLVAYFALGYGLYAATTGSRVGTWFSLACLPAIAFHFANHPNYIIKEGVGRDLAVDFILLGILITTMTFLAFNSFRLFRRTDRFLGDVTYPLYMYHVDVLVVVMSFTTGYHYSVYIAGMVLSVLVAYALSTIIDPLVNRVRDRIRGQKINAPANSGGVELGSGIVVAAHDRSQPSTIIVPPS